MSHNTSEPKKLGAWDILVLLASITSIGILLIETFGTPVDDTIKLLHSFDLVICIFFGLDVIVGWNKTGWSKRYWKWGWLNVLAAMPIANIYHFGQFVRALRVLRLVRAIYKFKSVTHRTKLSENILDAQIIALGFFIFCTVLIVHAEQAAPNAMIKDYGDAFWWALVTLTTVGYGDFYPLTTEGKIIAAFLMLIGIGLFGYISAWITSKLIEQGQKEERHSLVTLHKEISELKEEVKHLRESFPKK